MRFPYRRYDIRETSAQAHVAVAYRPVVPLRVMGPAGDAVIYGLEVRSQRDRQKVSCRWRSARWSAGFSRR